MALTQKRKRAQTVRRRRKVADMTPDELSTMITDLIERKMAEWNTPSSTKSLITKQMRKRAVSAAGQFHSGHSDTSINHDGFLTTSYSK